MLLRFCLYGFLKNQRYFEPFFMLALLAHGLSFTEVGLLVACQALTLNLLEIPSGVIADRLGRRRCMIMSFVAYIASFITFALAPSPWLLYPAMALFGVGDSFRTGTHKAMIFEWLRLNGMEERRTEVYGLTRSWSKYGSALSAVLSAVCVWITGDFRQVFLWACLPYALNVINMVGYPAELDYHNESGVNAAGYNAVDSARPRETLRSLVVELWGTVRIVFSHRSLRRLLLESMTWEGIFTAIKDYLQPALLALTFGAILVQKGNLNESDAGFELAKASDPKAVVLIAGTYAVLSLLSGFASRHAHRFAKRFDSEDRASRQLWLFNISAFASLAVCDLTGWPMGVVLAFVLFNILQNIWRPILVSRIDDHGFAERGATILSIESQSHRLVTLVLAPLIGLALDWVRRSGLPGEFWPIAVCGLLLSLPMLLLPQAKCAAE